MLLLFYEFPANRLMQGRAFLMVVNGSTFWRVLWKLCHFVSKEHVCEEVYCVRECAICSQSYRICVSRFMYLVLVVSVIHSVLFVCAWIIW